MGGGGNKKQGSGSGDLIGGAMNAYKMFSGNKGGNGKEGQGASASASGGSSTDMINSAMKVYKMFSGGKGTEGSSGSSGGGNIFDTIGM